MQATPQKLPVFKTTRDVYAVTLRYLGQLFGFAWPWLLALVGISGVLYWSFYDAERDALASGGSTTLWFLTALASTILGAVIAVPWHRRVLLGEVQTLRSGLTLNATTWAYIIRALGLMLAMIAPLLALFLLPTPPAADGEVELTLRDAIFFTSFGLWVVVAIFFLSRISLFLPAIAVGDAKVTLARSWQATRGNTWRLAWVSILATFLPAILIPLGLSYAFPTWSGALVANAASERMSFTIANVVSELAAMLFGMLYVTFLSLAYRHFFGSEIKQAPPVST